LLGAAAGLVAGALAWSRTGWATSFMRALAATAGQAGEGQETLSTLSNGA
jgi:hypothetical protein